MGRDRESESGGGGSARRLGPQLRAPAGGLRAGCAYPSPGTGRMKFLVVGAGSIGKRHAANLLALGAGEIVVVDSRADRRQEVERRFGVRTAADVTTVLDDPGLDGVLVCTPTAFHLE